jgi:ATP-dependent Clp protease adaptor protein ClpS
MEFVVNVLQHDLGMSRKSAVAAMLHIHHRGSVLLPVGNLSRAEDVAAAITTKARDSGHPLVCRVAGAQETAAVDRP